MYPAHYRKNAADNPWFWTANHAGRNSRVRLVCLPYAGGGAGVFAPWAKLLPESIDVWAARLPGRESRWKETPLTDAGVIASALATEIEPYLTELPVVFLGYSVGSLIGFELLRELRRRAVPFQPAVFIAVARGAPHLPLRMAPVHHLPDPEFLDAIGRRYQGIPKMVLEDKELLNLYLPPLRADIRVNESYGYRDEPALEVPIVAMGGLDDPMVSLDDLSTWRAQTRSTFEMEVFPGGHFFGQEQRPQLIAALRRRLLDLRL